MKFIYDNYDQKRNHPYPNLWDKTLIDYFEKNDGDYNTANQNKFQFRTFHSNIWWYNSSPIGNHEYINNVKDDEKYVYPIEIFSQINYLIGGHLITDDGIEYSFNIKNISKEAIKLALEDRLIFAINYSHEPFLNSFNFIKKLEIEVNSMGLDLKKHFVFFMGTSNLFEQDERFKNYNFYFEDNLLIGFAQRMASLKSEPNYTLGYETKWIRENEIDIKRNKHFVCLNRNSNKDFRYTMGCFFESKNLWDKLYASFLFHNEGKHRLYITNNKTFDNDIKNSADGFASKLIMEIDTHGSDDKQGFECGKAYKREVFLDSYIYIVTETNFEKDIFITEKVINPITTLQPFILVGACGYLKYFRSLGFKTFDGFIDESYDEIENDGERYIAICNEIERLSKLDLDIIHEWYLSIKDILVYNRNHILLWATKKENVFVENLKKHI
jgi:hypothetical protein